MKKSITILHQNRMKLTGTLFGFTLVVITFFLTACEKELQPAPDAALLKTETLSELKGREPDITVTAGSSIQAAVDAAVPGDIIQIEAGLYKEAIVVNKPGITLIGRGRVIIANPGEEEDGIRVTADGDGFKLYHITLRDFTENGAILIRADDYVLSHVTAINCGEYGLFPIASNRGLIEYCVASGHTDTGIYIGQCEDTKMRFNRAFKNVIGLEIENCTRAVVSNNLSYNNVAGILVVLLPGLPVTTSSDIVLRDNVVVDNNHVNFAEPGSGFESFVPSGSGILVVGTDNTRLVGNYVLKNNFLGIAVLSSQLLGGLAGLPAEAFSLIEPNPDGTQVIKNVVRLNGAAPPALPVSLPGVDLFWDGSGTSNCWRSNLFTVSYPGSLPICPDYSIADKQ